MALINCPECGKEVSDSAVMCPNCGYNVKNHVDNQKTNIDKQDVSVEQKIKRDVSNKPKSNRNYDKKKITIIACISIVVLFIAFVFGSKIVNYNTAVKYYDMQEWSMAIEKFEELGNFSDSQELLQKAKIELASDDYELGVYAYNEGEFATSVYLLEEAYSLCPTYSGLKEQLELSEFMNELQGTWNSTKIYIEVDGFRARLKDYNCTSYADYCDITPYKDDEGYYAILVKGESGNRTWELKYMKGTSDPTDELDTDWIGYASNMDGTGMRFRKSY